jgi:hypothetical protein
MPSQTLGRPGCALEESAGARRCLDPAVTRGDLAEVVSTPFPQVEKARGTTMRSMAACRLIRD